MKIKRILKSTGNFLKSSLTEPEKKVAEKIIDLNPPKFRPKNFSEIEEERLYANFLGKNFQIKRVTRAIDRKAAPRLKTRKHNGETMLSPEAVERLKKRKLEKIESKSKTTVGQDLSTAAKKSVEKTGEIIKKTPQLVKETPGKIASGAKHFYEHTGEVAGKVASFARKHPAPFAAKVIGSVGGKAMFAFPETVDLAMIGTLGPGYGNELSGGAALVESLVSGGHKIARKTINGDPVTRNVYKANRAWHAKNKVGGDWSIKRGVDKVKQIPKKIDSVLSLPPSPNVYPKPALAY